MEEPVPALAPALITTTVPENAAPPRTMEELLEFARAVARGGRKTNKNEVADFMADLLMACAATAPPAPTEAPAPVQVPAAVMRDPGLDEIGFFDGFPVAGLVVATNNRVFIPMNVCGYYTPQQAGSLAGAICRTASQALVGQTPTVVLP